MRLIWALVLTLWGVGAASAQSVMVVGDSIMAWNGSTGQAIGDVLAKETGLRVQDRSVPGAEMSRNGGLKRLLDIRRQPGRQLFDVLILTGGGNDLMRDCRCGRCKVTLDGLIGPDLQGEITDFVVPLARQGKQVIYLGYYGTPAGGGPFGACAPHFKVLDARMAALASRVPGLTFVSARQAINPKDLSLYARDRVHPSPKGSALIGKLLARVVEGLPG